MTDESNASASPPSRRERSLIDRILAVFGAYHIACVCFIFMFILTLLGTLNQKDNVFGLYKCQLYYFESWYVPREAWLFGRIPLPGMALVLAVMFVNILAGGILRVKKNKRTIGVVISHASILGFIIAGAVSLWKKVEGHMQVNEKGSSSIVQSAHDWVLEVRELKTTEGKDPQDRRVRFIRDRHFRHCGKGVTCDFVSNSWPFTLTVTDSVRNADVVPADEPALPGAPREGGFALLRRPDNPQNEANVGGARVEVKDKAGKLVRAGISTPLEVAPIVFETEGRRFSIAMSRERWEVPFSLYLEDFRAEYYPGTRKARAFESDVKVKHASGKESTYTISMNNPLRDSGYVAYQTDYDHDSPQGQEKYSVFTVVKNPSDQWPLYSLIVCTIGLLIHFLVKLFSFLDRDAARRQAAATSETV